MCYFIIIITLFAEALILFCQELVENFNDREIPRQIDERSAEYRELTSL